MLPQVDVLQTDPRLQTRSITPELIAYVAEKIGQAIHAECIVLFGSWARGTAHPDSDIDLLVVHGGSLPNRDVWRKIMGALGRYGFEMDLLIRTIEQVDRQLADNDPFYVRHVFGEGKVLWGKARPMRADPSKLPIETPKGWLKLAESDWQVAATTLKDDVPAYHTICFLCQSAAEKFLKAYLISKGWVLEKTHRIDRLIDLCGAHDDELGAMKAEGELLNQFVIAGRYPDENGVFADYTRTDAANALQAARRIRDRVNTLMAPPPAGE
jgi:HEPN domain-containing protein/predicted nucleotidyltransferase